MFVNIGSNLANKIPQCDLTFKSHLSKVNATLSETVLSEDEFKEAFKLLKINKAPGHGGLHVNIIKKPLLKIFNESINLGIFPENLKITPGNANFEGNANFQIWQKRVANKLLANFCTFVFL